jgi:hypothetical protein
MKLYVFCCKADDITIPLEEINSVYLIRFKTETNTTSSAFYRIGIRYKNNKNLFVFRGLFKYFLINSVIKLRHYICNIQDTYEKVENELRENINKL